MSPRKRPKQEIAKKKPATVHIETVEKDNMGPFQFLMVLCFFWASIQTLILFNSLELTFLGLLKTYSLFLGLSFLIPIGIYRKKLTISFYEYIILNVLSVAPAALALIFMFNTLFSSEVYVEKHKIVEKRSLQRGLLLFLENDAYEDTKHLRMLRSGQPIKRYGSEELHIFFSDGLLGFRIVESREMH